MADNRNVDLGNLKSRDIGNMIGKKLVELGKNEVRQGMPEDSVDYGDLPSRALPELGKRVISDTMKTEKTTLI
jgi:hypothetical protein